MQRIYIFIICCIAGIIGTSISMVFHLHWSCMIGTIIFVVAIALSLDTYFKEKRDRDERVYTELSNRKRTLNQFITEFHIDQARAEQLYQAGFRSMDDFKTKSVEDLMLIDNINPTLAKRIVQKMQ